MRRPANWPTTMANCQNVPSRPRILVGEISAMYPGTTALAAPMPSPVAKRNTPSSTRSPVRATANDPATIVTPARSMTRLRPHCAALEPENQAPTAQPIRAIAATKPTAAAPNSIDVRMPTMAAFIVEVSYPNRKPPNAAPAARAVT